MRNSCPVVLAALLLAAAGWAGAVPAPPSEVSADGRFVQAAGAEGLVWAHARGSGDGVEAHVTGTMTLVAACGSVLSAGGPSYPVIWPAGTTVGDGQIVLPDGEAVPPGVGVSGAGGYGDSSNFSRADGEPMVPAECGEEIAYFNASEDVVVVADGG